MFAYLIIGIELAILYFVFWVVFIREPKPREIRPELWGRYEGINNFCSDIQNRQTSLINEDRTISLLPSRVQARLYKVSQIRKRRSRRHIKHHCFCNCHERKVLNTWRGRQTQIVSRDINKQLAEQFLLLLNRTLNKLSVKVPTLDP